MNLLSMILSTIKTKKRLLQACFLGLALAGLTFASMAKEDHDDDEMPSVSANKKAPEHKEEHEEKTAVLSAEQIRTAAISVAQVGPASIRETLPLYGTVEANGERIQHLSARFPGMVRSVTKKVGDTVRQDEVLATVEGNESLRTYSLTAAFSGVVAERNANAGEHTGDKSLLVVVDLSSVWVEVSVFPRDVTKVHVGQTVRVTNPINDASNDGNIIAISALGNSNQTLTARVLLENPEHQWIPGLFVNANVTLATTSVKLAIRNEALQELDGKQVVFVKGKQGFEPRSITLGRTDGEISEVLAGLRAGETYVTKNSFIIKAELGKDGVEHE
jgi:membrane fusion protein, heavy metal efflux system